MKDFSKVEVTVAQIKERTLEQEKVEQLKKIKEHQALPPISGGLPAVGSKGGKFEVDELYLKKTQMELDRLADFDQPKV